LAEGREAMPNVEVLQSAVAMLTRCQIVRDRRPVRHSRLGSAVQTAVSDPRFWARVNSGSSGPYSCWEYQGHRDRQGYGMVNRGGNVTRAHRHAYALTHGPIAAGVVIRHTCDNPPCANPAHLVAGTQGENIADRQKRGRHRPGRFPGERHHNARLTDADVLAARAARADGETIRSIARRYGISPGWMGDVLSGKAWSHLEAA
jgi:hypothetical protein